MLPPKAVFDLLASQASRLFGSDSPLPRAGLEAQFKALLQSAFRHTHFAKDGEGAIALARHTRFDLILMDMQLPGLDGAAASRQIRALPLNATTPIIAITANACEEDRQTCLAAGMSDSLTKPVAPERLYSAARRWLVPAPAQVAG